MESQELSLSGASSEVEADREPRVLIVHASVGSGHRSAANAVAQAMELVRDDAAEAAALGIDVPGNLKVEVLDVLDFGRIVFNGDRTASMFTGFTRPYYDLTWRYTLTGRLLWAGGTAWARVMYPKFTEYVRTVRPLAIVCTHIVAANVAVSARMITGQSFPIVCVPTDYEVEGMWPHLHTDLFCVANEYMAETLRPRRVPEDRIFISGIPTRPAFRTDYDRAQTRAQFALPDDAHVVLALAGAKLPRPYVHFREALDQLIPYLHTFSGIHLVIVAGSDDEYARHARRLVADHELANVTVLGYVEDMAALMAASDLVICKSGGLTVTECLCAGVPMILMGRAYGQEKANVRMLTAAGAALHATTARELVDTLRHVNAHPESTHAMLVNASFLRKPDAALDITRATFKLVELEPSTDVRLRKKHFLHFYWGRKPAHIR
ncbi:MULTISPECIES: glycosyltransferase [unclassified Adlercreutzia]|uniref:glycosyltransferase n=1 Tax=unclassified Adlercreutzia TaxID=2636013 RepID=UPI001F14D757|nr:MULTISPECIES: glycosyltransferase [unclassified Adlercreutzia]